MTTILRLLLAEYQRKTNHYLDMSLYASEQGFPAHSAHYRKLSDTCLAHVMRIYRLYGQGI